MVKLYIIVTVLLAKWMPRCAASKVNEHSALRMAYSTQDDTGKYPYVVSLLTSKLRHACTGSLITPNWVLSAAYCCKQATITEIQYGNTSEPASVARTKSKVHKCIVYPQYRFDLYQPNDVALFLVDTVSIDAYGVVLAVDFFTLTGLSIEYAGYGLTHTRPLQLGEGVIGPCLQEFKGFICIAQKCSVTQVPMKGDSGGPLFVENKIVGVVAGDLKPPKINDRYFTPVSPYLEWINRVISSVGA